jgi:hypothetical protein
MRNLIWLGLTVVFLTALSGTAWAQMTMQEAGSFLLSGEIRLDGGFSKSGNVMLDNFTNQKKAEAGAEILATENGNPETIISSRGGRNSRGSWEQYVHAFNRLSERLTDRRDLWAYLFICLEPIDYGCKEADEPDEMAMTLVRWVSQLRSVGSFTYYRGFPQWERTAQNSNSLKKAPTYEKVRALLLVGDDRAAYDVIHSWTTSQRGQRFNKSLERLAGYAKQGVLN